METKIEELNQKLEESLRQLTSLEREIPSYCHEELLRVLEERSHILNMQMELELIKMSITK